VLALAIDTSTESTTVAVGTTSGEVLIEQAQVAGNRHGELLAPMIAAALADAGGSPGDLGRIVVGVGPGPFTGLRVGMMTAVALGQALGVEVVGVCSLDAVASAPDSDRPWDTGFTVLADARRREVYRADYVDGRRTHGPLVARPADLTDLPAYAVGAGALLHRDALPSGTTVGDTAPYPSAAALLTLAQDPTWLLPVRPLYLRRPDAIPPGRPKAVTPA
jgi:tRNA threonylcarbamoyl adenosine modification protein YeaZ